MSNKYLDTLFTLNEKALGILKSYSHFQQNDIRKVHFRALSSQIINSHINYTINLRFSETNRNEFLDIFKSDLKQVNNYAYNIIQILDESILSTALFQSELIFRFYYSKFSNSSPSKEKNLFKIISLLYEDVENNWNKEDCKLIVLLWTIRNTIHTGGIYFDNENGRKIVYKNQEYFFQYGKSPKFLGESEGFILDLISDLFDALNLLFNSGKIKGLGIIEHPIYHALES